MRSTGTHTAKTRVGNQAINADTVFPGTWNCRHIANAHELPRVYQLLGGLGYGQLLICTPAEFLGGDDDDGQKSNS